MDQKNEPIGNFADWERQAAPRSPSRWRRGRGAYELARVWCGANGLVMPGALGQLLDSREETRSLVIDSVWPGHPIRFDRRQGQPRSADLAILGRTAVGPVAVLVEARAEESFGATVAEAFVDALERFTETPRSQGIGRIEDLSRALFASRDEDDAPRVGVLRYQLLMCAAGALALAEGHGAGCAVLVVHGLYSTLDDQHPSARHAADLSAFLHRLGGVPVDADTFSSPALFGPYTVPGVPLFDGPRQILVGMIATSRKDS